MNETWRDIKGFEGYYQVSDLGRVRSVTRLIEYKNGKKANHKGRILEPKLNHGYLRVSLSKNNKWKEYRIHRLVAENFLENPMNKPSVNHIDEDKTNNRLENLEWVTPKENLEHSKDKYLEGLKNKYKKVKVIDDKGNIYTYQSVKECIEDLGISDGTLCRKYGEIFKRGKFKGWCFYLV